MDASYAVIKCTSLSVRGSVLGWFIAKYYSFMEHFVSTHWGRVAYICVGKLTIIGSDNVLSPDRRQAIIWNIVGILLIRTWGTNFGKTLSEIHTFSSKKMHFKTPSAKLRQFYPDLDVSKTPKHSYTTDVVEQKVHSVMLLMCVW